MRTSEKLDQLLPALTKARQQFGDIKKSKTNPHFHYTYAALDDILPAITDALAQEGLILLGNLENSSQGTVSVTTRLMHTSEQWIESSVDLSYEFGELPKLGAEVTYLRRYSINTMLQLAAGDDLDEQGSPETPSKRTQTRLRAQAPSLHTRRAEAAAADQEDQRAELIEAIQTLLVRHTKDAVKGKDIRRAWMQEAFEVTRWSDVKALDAITLERGLKRLMDLVAPVEDDEVKAEAETTADAPLAMPVEAAVVEAMITDDDPPEPVLDEEGFVETTPSIDLLRARADYFGTRELCEQIISREPRMTAGVWRYAWVEVGRPRKSP